ncbi:unnamed protein product [Rangifer tarandus platyrhynchus]|uniref:Uncharacterized protein n=1 Tax=Rangifer tarandus platyrhynchus TaxID=3082113 RepID=A0ABN8YCV4_RANTA|nr:unnamed protein product [Rangifer tarandus platyrhynchus]
MDGSPTLLLSSKEPTYNAGAMDSFLGQEDPLEKEMPSHSSFLAWKNAMDSPWGHKRVRHHLATIQPPPPLLYIHSFLHLFIHSLLHLFIHSLTPTHPVISSFLGTAPSIHSTDTSCALKPEILLQP